MKIGIIIGSHRHDSQSAKVADYIAKQLDCDLFTLDLGKNPLPLWEEKIWNDDPQWRKILDPLQAELRSCDGFIIISPEYSGMVPAALKNFFLMVDDTMWHKPGLIIGVSASNGGRYPIAELRMSSYKNTKIIYVPDHIYIQKCHDVLNEQEPVDKTDAYIRDRIAYSLGVFLEYTKALPAVRNSGKVETQDYVFGM